MTGLEPVIKRVAAVRLSRLATPAYAQQMQAPNVSEIPATYALLCFTILSSFISVIIQERVRGFL